MVNDPKTWVECDCERIFLNALDGSCKTPIGAYAKITNKDPTKILLDLWLPLTMATSL